MDACDEYEIAIEMRLQGAGGPAAGERLDAHLAGCSDCRAFETGAKAMTAAFHQEVEKLDREIDWQRLRKRVRRTFDPAHRAAVRAGSVAAFAVLIAGSSRLGQWIGHKPVQPIWPVATAVLIVGALAYAWVWSRGRRVAEAVAQSSQTEMFELYRAEIAARIGTSRAWRFRSLAVTGAFVLGFILVATPPQNWTPGPGDLAEFLVFVLPLFALGLYLHAVRIPELKRELRELE